MAEPFAFPDTEAALVGYLNAELNVPVATRVPNPRPGEFVRVVRVGGTRRNLVTDSAMTVIECWAASDVAAYALARRARAFIGALPGQTVNGAWFRRVTEVGGPQNLPDPQSGTPRYVFTVSLDVKGEVL